MTHDSFEDLKGGDRVSHVEKGLGTVSLIPETEDMVVSEIEARKDGPGMIYVAWDDERFPVGNTLRSELEKLPDASIAISTGV